MGRFPAKKPLPSGARSIETKSHSRDEPFRHTRVGSFLKAQNQIDADF
jgi:hypothetical protein